MTDLMVALAVAFFPSTLSHSLHMSIWAVRSCFKSYHSPAGAFAATAAASEGNRSSTSHLASNPASRPKKHETKTAALHLLLQLSSSIFRVAAHNLDWLLPARWVQLALPPHEPLLLWHFSAAASRPRASGSIIALWSSKSSSRWLFYASNQTTTKVTTCYSTCDLRDVLHVQPAASVVLEALVDCVNSHPFPPPPSMLMLPEDSEAIG
jgi:hypothetical protein